MTIEELDKYLKLSYYEYIDFLLDKYGKVKYNYFCTPECKTINSKISRSKEGLECHHIKEIDIPYLSDSENAKNNPFEYQQAENLVYCNLIEHLILHFKISENSGSIGLGVKLICKKINMIFDRDEKLSAYLQNLKCPIENDFSVYIKLLENICEYDKDYHINRLNKDYDFVNEIFHISCKSVKSNHDINKVVFLKLKKRIENKYPNVHFFCIRCKKLLIGIIPPNNKGMCFDCYTHKIGVLRTDKDGKNLHCKICGGLLPVYKHTNTNLCPECYDETHNNG